MSNIDYKRISKEISYNALKKGNGSVWWLTKNSDTDNGFDMISVEGNSRELIGVKATAYQDAFCITDTELMMMDTPRPNMKYIIHRYRFNEGEVVSFNMYAYDSNKNVLVDVIDDTNICTIENGSESEYICTPKKIEKTLR